MAELYERIEKMCKDRGVSITEMCKQSGAPRGSLTDLKMGRSSSLRLETLSKIAVFFDVDVWDLVERKTPPMETKKDQPGEGLVNDDPELTEYLQELQSRPEMKMLFHTFKTATKEQIEAIVTAWEARNNIKGE